MTVKYEYCIKIWTLILFLTISVVNSQNFLDIPADVSKKSGTFYG